MDRDLFLRAKAGCGGSLRSRFCPRRRLKVPRNIARTCRRAPRIRAKPPPAGPTATTNPTADNRSRVRSLASCPVAEATARPPSL